MIEKYKITHGKIIQLFVIIVFGVVCAVGIDSYEEKQIENCPWAMMINRNCGLSWWNNYRLNQNVSLNQILNNQSLTWR